MGEWTSEAAEAAEQAWEVCQRVGERYLEARYEHEAQAAGFDITPPVVEDDFDPMANQIENLRSEQFGFAEAQAEETLMNLAGAWTISSRRHIKDALEEAVTRLQQLGS